MLNNASSLKQTFDTLPTKIQQWTTLFHINTNESHLVHNFQLYIDTSKTSSSYYQRHLVRFTADNATIPQIGRIEGIDVEHLFGGGWGAITGEYLVNNHQVSAFVQGVFAGVLNQEISFDRSLKAEILTLSAANISYQIEYGEQTKVIDYSETMKYFGYQSPAPSLDVLTTIRTNAVGTANIELFQVNGNNLRLHSCHHWIQFDSCSNSDWWKTSRYNIYTDYELEYSSLNTLSFYKENGRVNEIGTILPTALNDCKFWSMRVFDIQHTIRANSLINFTWSGPPSNHSFSCFWYENIEQPSNFTDKQMVLYMPLRSDLVNLVSNQSAGIIFYGPPTCPSFYDSTILPDNTIGTCFARGCLGRGGWIVTSVRIPLNFTIQGWFNPSAAQNIPQVLFGSSDVDYFNPVNAEFLVMLNNNKMLQIVVNGQNLTNSSVPFTGQTGDWFHLAITYNHNSSVATLYVNGTSLLQLGGYSQTLLRGAFYLGSTRKYQNNWFYGRMYEVAMHNWVWNQTSIMNAYQTVNSQGYLY